jgi:hypothetical protein
LSPPPLSFFHDFSLSLSFLVSSFGSLCIFNVFSSLSLSLSLSCRYFFSFSFMFSASPISHFYSMHDCSFLNAYFYGLY